MSIKVTLNIEEEIPAEFEFNAREVAQAVCIKILEAENCPVDTEISLMYVDTTAIQEINADSRGVDAPTDVLSFPNLEFPAASLWEAALTDTCSADIMDPDSGNLLLGDIVLNLDFVRLQAREYGHSERREFAFLIAHSMLHLCGYDHETQEEAGIMFARQETALQELGITRQ